MTAGLEAFVHVANIAYFSMEIALRSDIPTYSGGLGILAGDTMRSAADLELPMVGVTLVSRAGYFRQEIEDGRQQEQPEWWDPATRAQRLPAKVAVPVGDAQVWVGAWLYQVDGHCGGIVPIILLDTDVAENVPQDRELTHYLYGGDQAYRLRQEMVLGIGGARMLHALGFEISKYHLNEGHAAFLTLELLRRLARSPSEAGADQPAYDAPAVRQLCVFTTHTPVEAGHDQFPYEMAAPLLSQLIESAELRRLAGDECLNMTRLALNLSEHVNGVARRHAEVSRRLFPGYKVHAVTNGVHPWTWASDAFRRLYARHMPHWCHEPELLARADLIPDEEVFQAHREAKSALIAFAREAGFENLNPDLPILGFARRMTPYKRPELFFSDLDRLRAIAARQPFQVVLAGKAHPRDFGGKEAIERLSRWALQLRGAISVVFLPNYDMNMARLLTSGSDVWLNTPLRPLEASGTSGMKAALNGVPSLSVPDGWWLEGWIEGVTGWAVGSEADADNALDGASLYHKLEQRVLPCYYAGGAAWVAVMKGAIARNASYFNSHRMMRRYATEAYLR